MTGCNEYKELMHKLLDREISPRERARLEQHISLCSNCAGELKAIESGLDMLTAMPVPEPGAEFTSETIKKAFMAKKALARRQKTASWCMSALIGIISLSIIAGCSLVFQPVMEWALLKAVQVLSQLSILLTALNKTVSVINSILWTLGSVIYKIVCSECNPGLIFLASLLVMVFLNVISRGKSPGILLTGGKK